jgi:hypothetical protein
LTFLHHVFRQVSIQGRDNSILIVSFVKSRDQYYFHLLSYHTYSLLLYNESKLSECQAVQFTMKVNFLNVNRYNLQWK